MTNQSLLRQNLATMISIPSINPFGCSDHNNPAESAMADFFQKSLSNLGLETFSHIVAKGRKNVWGVLRGQHSGPTILLAGHLDTVGVDGYKDPFIPRVVGDRIYGRGACDMKGGLAAILETARVILNNGILLDGDLIIAGIVDEENAMAGSKHFGSYGPKVDFAIVAEPTNLIICPRHKGQICFSIQTHGLAAHSSNPENGINAIYHMNLGIQKLRELGQILEKREIDPTSDYPSLNIGVIRGGSHHSAVPDFCEIEVDRRTIFGETKNAVMAEFVDIFENLKNQNKNFTYEISDPILFVPPLQTPESSFLIKELKDATREVLGKASKIETFPGSTDAPNFKCSAVIFGAGNLEQCHSLTEYINLKDLEKAVRVYVKTIENLQGRILPKST